MMCVQLREIETCFLNRKSEVRERTTKSETRNTHVFHRVLILYHNDVVCGQSFHYGTKNVMHFLTTEYFQPIYFSSQLTDLINQSHLKNNDEAKKQQANSIVQSTSNSKDQETKKSRRIE